MGAEAGADMGADMGAEMGQMQRWRARLHENEVSVLLILRLVPVVPFFAVNLLAALAGVRFGHFLWTTALGILPGALVFTSVGVGLGDVLDQGAEPDLAILWQPQVLAPLLGLAALAALPMLWRAWRRRKGERAG